MVSTLGEHDTVGIALTQWAQPLDARTLSDREAPCENAPLFETDPFAMDIERINQIGNTLADLSSRTEALRRYL